MENGKSPERPTLQVGWWAAISLKGELAPLRCYVGQIESVDDRGIRITLLDWLIEAALSWDLFVPWECVGPCLIATEEHDSETFGEAAAKWRTTCNQRSES